MTEVIIKKPECVCGCSYASHTFNINRQPEGEPEYESGACFGDCLSHIDANGDAVSDCPEYTPELAVSLSDK